jgi:hypothetical protein
MNAWGRHPVSDLIIELVSQWVRDRGGASQSMAESSYKTVSHTNILLQSAMLPSSVNACWSADNTALVPGLRPLTFDNELQPLLAIWRSARFLFVFSKIDYSIFPNDLIITGHVSSKVPSYPNSALMRTSRGTGNVSWNFTEHKMASWYRYTHVWFLITFNFQG